MSDLTDNEPCRLSGESGTTHEAGSDNDAHASTTIHVRASTHEDVLTRYLNTVKAIQREIALFNAMEGTRMYSLSPVLLVDNVDADVLDMFPSSVGEHQVKLMVTDRQLFITNVSMGDAHSCAVTSIIHQAGSWSRNVFSVKSNTKFESEDANYGSAPDLVIEVPSANLPDGAGQQRLGKCDGVFRIFSSPLIVSCSDSYPLPHIEISKSSWKSKFLTVTSWE